MYLNRTDKIVRWAYFTYEPTNGHCNAPKLSSLCAIFWRSVLWTPLKLLFPVACLVALCGVAWAKPKDFIEGAGIVIGVLGLIVLIAWLSDNQGPIVAVNEKLDDSVLWQGLKAVKSKACPLVYIDHGTTRNIYQEDGYNE